MIKKYSICIFVLLFTTILNAKQYSVCKNYHVVSQNESLKKRLFLEKIVDEEPNNIECILKLSTLYFQTDEASKAFDLITKAYRLDPKFVEKQKRVVKILDISLKLSGLKEYALKNKDIKSWNKLGRYYYSMRLFKESIKAYSNSLKIDSNQIKIQIMLALSYINNNEIDKALKQFRDIVQKDPENFYANYHIAKILKNRINNPKEAKPYFIYLEYLIEYKRVKLYDVKKLEFYKKDIKRELSEIKNYISR